MAISKLRKLYWWDAYVTTSDITLRQKNVFLVGDPELIQALGVKPTC